MDEHHPHFVALWLGEVFGGPADYSAERGDYRHMVSRHLGKHITEPQRRRWVNLLMDAADRVELPTDPSFRAAFAGIKPNDCVIVGHYPRFKNEIQENAERVRAILAKS